MPRHNIRLSESEREHLGKTATKSGQYSLTSEEYQTIREYRDGTTTNQYERKPQRTILTALNDRNELMDIDEYCEFYRIPREDVRSYKLVSHTGIPYYNIASGNIEESENDLSIEEIKELIADDLKSITYRPMVSMKQKRPIVVSIADLHFGAYVDGLKKTKPFSINILAELLQEVAERTNEQESSEVHVHILGDLIESFTGLNHKNSWKGLQKGMIGAEVVKLATQVIHDCLLSRIVNLKSVKIIAGNHDRVTASKEEDDNGDAANLIAWGLELIGYDVEFDGFVLTHLVDGINYIMLHGHDAISRKSTKDICWDYGQQGVFNMITEGHLHSIIERLSAEQRKKFNVVKDDAVDHRRMNIASLFTGNAYSEKLGYTSNSGFIISYNNGKGVPNVYNIAV